MPEAPDQPETRVRAREHDPREDHDSVLVTLLPREVDRFDILEASAREQCIAL